MKIMNYLAALLRGILLIKTRLEISAMMTKYQVPNFLTYSKGISKT
jgi:hypothetical protein